MGFGNLGIALGAAANQMNIDRDAKLREDQFALQKAAEARAQGDYDRQKGIDERIEAVNTRFAGINQMVNAGDIHGATKALSDYHTNSGYLGDSRSQFAIGADGSPQVVFDDGKQSTVHAVTPQMLQDHLKGAYQHALLVAGDPRQAFQNMTALENLGLKRAEIAVHQDKNQVAREGNQIHDRYYQGVLNKPVYQTGGNGQILQFNPQGGLVGTFGSPRPDHTGAAMAQTNAILKSNGELNAKYAPLFEQAEKDVADAYKTGDPQAIRAAQAKAIMVNNSYQREMATKNPSAGGLRLNFPTEANVKESPDISASDKIRLTAYEKALGNLEPPRLTGNQAKDDKAMASYDAQLQNLASAYRVTHLVGGTNAAGGVPVRQAPGGKQPAAPATTVAPYAEDNPMVPGATSELEESAAAKRNLAILNSLNAPQAVKPAAAGVNPRTGRAYGQTSVGGLRINPRTQQPY